MAEEIVFDDMAFSACAARRWPTRTVRRSRRDRRLLGSSDRLDAASTQTAKEYAVQSEPDHSALVDAANFGRVTGWTGM